MSSSYAVGTVSAGAGSTTVTGTGTAWASWGVRPGDVFQVAGLDVLVAAVVSNTQITLARPWPGAALTNANYDILVRDDPVRVLTASNNLLLALGGNGNLTSLGGLASAANTLPFFSGPGAAALTPLTAFARSLIDDADATAARATLGLGTAATRAATTSTTDTTAARLMAVGDFGLGAPVALTGTTPLHERNLRSGFYSYGTLAIPGGPETEDRAHALYVNPHALSGRTTYLSVRTAGVGTDIRIWLGQQTGTSVPITWYRIFTQGSVLGAVSQSGGLPTGALIERGSNANGEFARFADGTQICTHAVSASLAIDTALLGGFRSAAQTWTYPAAFVAAPHISVSARNLTASGAITANVPGATTVQYALTAVATQTAATREASLLAVGRWF